MTTLETLLAAVDPQRLRRDVEHIATQIPYRLAGTAAANAMARYSASRLAEAGARSRVESVRGLVSIPGAASLTVSGMTPSVMPAQTCGHSPETAAAGLAGDLVDAGGGVAADYRRIDARGKIVLLDLALAPARPEKQRLAAAAGAVGCVTFNWGRDDGAELPFGSVKPAWGNPTRASMRDEMPTLPCIGIGRAHGLALQRRLGAGAAHVRMHAQCDNGWRDVDYTIGAIDGNSADFVIAGGHQDSWIGPAATDNATGSACLLELARLFASRSGQLRRGLVFGFWAGHETGTMLSSAHYVDRNWDQLREHAVAYLQIDQPACRGAAEWTSHSNNELKRFQHKVDVALLNERPRRWRRSTKIGDASFFGLGVPMLSSIAGFTQQELQAHGNAAFGWWHHTTENTLDKVDFDDLVVHARVYAAYLWELGTLPILPLDFTTVAKALEERIAELAITGGAFEFRTVLSRAHALHAATQRLAYAVEACNANAKHQRRIDEVQVERFNRILKRLSRLLLPLECTAVGTYGHDPYGMTAQTSVIPSLYEIADWAALPDGEARELLSTSLRRERNRVADTLADACALIEATLAR